MPTIKGGRLQCNVDIVYLQHGCIRVESVRCAEALTNVTEMNNLLHGTVGGHLRVRAMYSTLSRTILNCFCCFTKIFPLKFINALSSILNQYTKCITCKYNTNIEVRAALKIISNSNMEFH